MLLRKNQVTFIYALFPILSISFTFANGSDPDDQISSFYYKNQSDTCLLVLELIDMTSFRSK